MRQPSAFARGGGGGRRVSVSVVIPVLNGERTIGDCLASVLSVSYPAKDREIIVVDNGSTDRTPQIVQRYPVRYVYEGRRGLSHARNRGIEESRGEIVAFTDADCLVSTRWLTELVTGFGGDDVFAVVGETVAYPPSTPTERYWALRKPTYGPWTLDRPVPWFTFMSAALRRGAFERVGTFDGRFAGVGSEDIDFGWRFFRAGLAAHRRPRAIVFHRHRSTTRSFIRQQVGYGRGQAVLASKYPDELHWGWREELSAWSDLGVSVPKAASAFSSRDRDGQTRDPAYAYVDVLRRAAQRSGFVYETLRLRRARAGNRTNAR